MKIYLVGGAVRDKLLKLPIHERDWVIVGATPTQLVEKNFQQVGKDFPVFLHPQTKEEYALARTERKTAPGYKGFMFHTSPDITLEEDLLRRDLTINAMAEDEHGNITDPYQGQYDIRHKILRHVSPAFVEDPVRILRVARFAARFAYLGFTVAPDTMALMCNMVEKNEVQALVSERVTQEFYRALTEKNPEVFFEILLACHALQIIFPEIDTHFNEVKHFLLLSTADYSDASSRLIALLQGLPVDDIQKLARRFKFSQQDTDAALLLKKYSTLLSEAATAEDIMSIFEKFDAFRRADRFKMLLALWDMLYKKPQQMSLLLHAFNKTQNIITEPFLKQGLSGIELGKALRQAKIDTLADIVSRIT
jgi:tRNA nucleotidyltransferase (CCA-adding enzyme)